MTYFFHYSLDWARSRVGNRVESCDTCGKQAERWTLGSAPRGKLICQGCAFGRMRDLISKKEKNDEA